MTKRGFLFFEILFIGGILFFLALVLKGQPAPPGWWKHGVGCLPCTTQAPYVSDVCPSNGRAWYLRYDATMPESADWINVTDEAIYVGQGGGMHTAQYNIQTSAGSQKGWIIPMARQVAGGGWVPAPAPYRDVPIKNSPGDTLCSVYKNTYGGTATCPSDPLTYSNRMKTFAEWTAAWPGVNTNIRQPQCTNVPPTFTKTPTRTPTKIPVTGTVTPIPGNCPTPRPDTVCIQVTVTP